MAPAQAGLEEDTRAVHVLDSKHPFRAKGLQPTAVSRLHPYLEAKQPALKAEESKLEAQRRTFRADGQKWRC